ncbi:MAG: serine/threonine protein kinase [Deltaproteobacteria bacterium]|nr:serine/threonine protein kinase [Deltaproteobacteria bacterium]
MTSSILCEHCGEEHSAEVQHCPRARRIVRPERFYPLGSTLGGKYRLERVLGSGGMAAVFEATHTLLRKRVAVKVLMPQTVGNPEMVARMVREARAASATGHVNIAQVTDMGLPEEGGLYLVMELVHGQTLRQVLARRGKLPFDEAVLLIDQVLAGLAAVHARGIVHRDLKPDNVMVEEGPDGPRAKILDFGIAKPLQDEDLLSLTGKGQIIGTPRYMAPEQALGREVDARSDIFTAGALLYVLLTGQPAIAGKKLVEVIGNVRQARVVAPGSHVPRLPPALEEVVLTALALDPERRFSDARAFRAALAPFLPPERKRKPSMALAGLQAKEDPPREGSGVPSVALERRQLFEAKAADEAPAVESEAQEVAESETAAMGACEERARWPGASSTEEEERSLQLDLAALRPSRPSGGQLYHAPSPSRRTYRALLVGLGLLLMVLVGLTQKQRLLTWITGESVGPAQVLIVLDPSPRDVRVSVDGQRHESLTLTLPHSQRDYRIRVEATGYYAKELTLRANETQLVSVQLERLKR